MNETIAYVAAITGRPALKEFVRRQFDKAYRLRIQRHIQSKNDDFSGGIGSGIEGAVVT
jgi:hypothetical protein